MGATPFLGWCLLVGEQAGDDAVARLGIEHALQLVLDNAYEALGGLGARLAGGASPLDGSLLRYRLDRPTSTAESAKSVASCAASRIFTKRGA